ncbi:nitrite reductase/ring-hydroxylating ferredoxin subunit [Novosphingobium chloroacetimidivorans]|uniref:Nitrite reductase/ring-hydroxylating ferredoxin subunit n=1 Tax=Novosphingobium chloroacetimidivorans TaxID=1428314 RepID=A0A7W7NUG9_9SPHN|nr:Rieske 2Fe-2S domain-containing protein [Novosphingobium chloroacetimidivorans]MBB4857498.1 nitrite reductase/ring-hydroxylating ferredoxin subunit [Novosphingobium chloroacetimidivorans]
MEFMKVASVADVAEGKPLAVEAGGHKLLLAKVDGALYATQRKCPHLGFILCRGRIEDRAIVCPLHKARFDLATGQVERDPRLWIIGMTVKSGLQTYPVRVEGGDVLIGV